ADVVHAEAGVADAGVGVPHLLPGGIGRAHELLGAEGALVELDRLGCAVHRQVGGDGVKTFGNGFDHDVPPGPAMRNTCQVPRIEGGGVAQNCEVPSPPPPLHSPSTPTTPSPTCLSP